MNTTIRGTLAALAISLLASGPADAGTQAILGKKLQLKDTPGVPAKRRIIGSGQERQSANTVAGNPTTSGAALTVIANGGRSSSQTFDLPSSGWSAISSLGYRWSNRGQPGNPVTRAIIKKTPRGTFQLTIKIDGTAGAVDVAPPNPGTSGGFVLAITGGDSYCVAFGGPAGGKTQRNDAGQWKIKSATAATCPAGLVVDVLSNRADLISAGDALVEVTLPAQTSASDVAVDVDGTDVTSAFALRPNGRYMGLVTGLSLGSSVLTAQAPGVRESHITITNHPHGGPVLSGPQLEPWVCQSTAVDAQCNEPPSYSYVYMSTDPSKQGFQSYDPNSPPTDVAETTTDQGVTVPFIVRVETGYQDRDQYQIATLFQPGQQWTPWDPQSQWNHKLLVLHGFSCGVDHQTGTAPDVLSASNGLDTGGTAADALGRGFMTMSTALDNAGHNCNLALQAESIIMAKEHAIETYGELRYTIGQGCSGGSLAAQWIANAYPGIYQGILPTCSFPDAWGTATQFLDYHLTLAYFTDPTKWGVGVVWLPTQMADVQGHVTIANSEVSDSAQFHVAVPTDPCAGVSAAERYDPQTNPGGVRCDIQDAAINLLGPRPPADWSANEQALGRGFAGIPIDNVGVQYGLGALQQGKITAAQFVDINQKIGGLDIDINPIPDRIKATRPALANAYRSGLINETNNLDQIPIIDCRGPDPGAFHDAYRAFAVRARLDREHGTHANQLIWEGPVLLLGDAFCTRNSFIAIDRWLTAIENDTGSASLPEKVIADKPADLGDQCYDGAGTKVSDGLCPAAVVPIYGTPRMVAGDALTTDANKCQLRPLNRNDDYGLIPLTDAQWATMQTIFPDGVCDFSKPGVDQQGTIPWQTYQDDSAGGSVIYGGTPLGEPPAAQ